MSRSKGKGGDFHQGVPDKHLGNKGDTTDDVRSSAEFRKLQEGELNVADDSEAEKHVPSQHRPNHSSQGPKN